jgi:SAM-dependent methyltransferase
LDEVQAETPTRFERFIEVTRDRPARELLVRALALVTSPGEALDLGAGAGNETLAMLRHGLRVTAIDGSARSIALIRGRAAEAGLRERLTLHQALFPHVPWGSGGYDLINAQFALPFCPTSDFAVFWRELRAALRPGGVFCGQLFGVRDSWAAERRELTFHTRDEVGELVGGLEVLELCEVDEDGQTALGTDKRWHIFHLLLRAP